MDVKITRKKGFNNVFRMEFDEEFMDSLSDEAQRTSTAMTKILEKRVLPKKPRKVEEGFKPMSHDFARKWVRFPQVIRRYLVSMAYDANTPISVAYTVNLITGGYKNDKANWDEDLEAYGELPPRSPYSYFSDILSLMVSVLVSYGAAIGDRGKFKFESEQRFNEFVDNDVNFGEWQDEIYGLRAKEPVAPSFENASFEDEEDTFD